MLSANEPGDAMIFRERGIYSLPNGRELIVLRNDEEGSVLFGPVNFGRIEMGEVLVNKAGRLVYQGKLTAWDITNLTDTGRTSRDIPAQSKDRSPQPEING
jgi:hypothetical protein